MIPPHYAILPPKLFYRSEIPLHLRWTYIVLYALAWRHQYQYVSETVETLAGMFSEVEGQEISERGIRERLQQLVNYGLISRERHGFHYRTILLLQHSTATAQPQQTATAQHNSHSTAQQPHQTAAGDAPGVTQVTLATSPNVTNTNNTVDDVVSGLDHQQQQLFYYLCKREVFPATALDFALKRIPLWDAVAWGEYAWARRNKLQNYAGLIVAKLGAGEPAPEVELFLCPRCGLRDCCDACGFYAALDEEANDEGR
jgi:predicted transcriptional regulator